MKSEVKYIRGNLSLDLWTFTQRETYLRDDIWINHAAKKLLDFENNILESMKTGGWDGVENPGMSARKILFLFSIGEYIIYFQNDYNGHEWVHYFILSLSSQQ